MAGGTGPVTLAGNLVIQTAEALSVITLSQIVQPGAPIVMGGSIGMIWLKNASSVVGSPEAAMLNAGVAKMAQKYNVPCLVGGT